ncbi:MAG TPA: MFS transporter [Dehalococcoidia bacterium]|jgi:MFS family permease|nr:MFS transporter [Dehalococcoidia bacterium]MEE2925893.1 MFS transporter [Chloroflexota bacterium]HIB11934.1 MFS transporter [Dehalococcoidia bacterium]HIM48739.1 MFS transporter [Dehalococcoidia bacterium]
MLKVDLRPANLAVGSREIHYGWVIVALASTMGCITSAVRFAAAALVPYLRDSASGFGWSYGAISLGFSLQWFVLGVVSPYIGSLGDRYGVRRLLFLGAFLFIAGMLLTGIMTSLWQFYLFFGVMLGIATTIFSILLVTGVTLWFRKHLGVAMGAVGSFQGAGSIGFLFLIAVAFDLLGMKWIFWIPGIAGGAIILLLIKFFYNEPADIGLRPLGAPKSEPIQRPQKDEMAKTRAKVFLQQAQRTGAFWNLIGIHFWGCMGHNIINVLLVAIAVDRGLSLGVAAGVLATQQITGVFARGAIPVIADRVGSKSVWVVGMSLQALPLLIILFVHDAWAFYLFAFLFGIGQGSEVPTFPIANRQYFGNVPQGSLYGWQNIGNGLGMGLAPVVAGFLWDITGTYAVPLSMALGFSLMALISALLLPSSSRNLIPHWEESLPLEARSPASP